MEQPDLLICACSVRHLTDSAAVRTLAASAKNAGLSVEIVPDLCHSAVKAPETVRARTIAACHSRAVSSLCYQAKHTPVTLIDLRTRPVSEALETLKIEKGGNPFEVTLPVYEGEWVPWFPVIDRDRCTNCGKCVDFCMFGVYNSDGLVEVAVPENCKTDCPACARICPETAIIFPKHLKSPINGGLEQEEETGIDPTALYAQRDLYQQLAARRRKPGNLTRE